MIKLDLGCGGSKRKGYIGVDTIPFPCIDIIHDLNEFPYPFEENTIDEIWMDNVIEHLKEPVKVIEELYRITKNNALVTISVPYFRSVYSAIDPTHVNQFTSFWFDYFDPDNIFSSKYNYSHAKYKIKKKVFDREWENKKISKIHKHYLNMANKNPKKYEFRYSHIYPLNSLTFTLETMKE